MPEEYFMEILRPLDAGERVFIGEGPGMELGGIAVLPPLPVGTVFRAEGKGLLKLLGSFWNSAGVSAASKRIHMVEAMADVPAGPLDVESVRDGLALAWITMSDKGSKGKRHDESGPLIAEIVGETLGLCHAQGFILPDDERELRALISDLALTQKYDLIMTTGGTGVAPRDVTPEATLAVIEKRLPGYERAMTAASLVKTPHGAVSRAVAGTLGGALVINMPGSPKAVKECLEPLLPTLGHTLDKLHGDPADCAKLRC